jgi:hypothetical protein
MDLLSAVARHERRVRLVFDGAIAAAAFNDTTRYSVTGDDGSRVPIAGLVGILGMPNQIDLALGGDLRQAALYTVAAAGAATKALVRLAAAPPVPLAAEVTPDNVLALLYGIDLVWNQQDYAETAAGDLATVEGSDNVQAALTRRFAAEGLPWDDAYGAKPRRFIDGSPGALPALRSTLVRQARLDDRVRAASAALSPEGSEFEVSVQLVGDDARLDVPAKAP